MDRLFSPWRSSYIESFSKPKGIDEDCILCSAAKNNDDENSLVISRGNSCFVIMNLYPYNSGHLMIVPYRHIASPLEMSDEESLETMSHIKNMMKALQSVLHPDGFNIGANVGRTAGAGIDKHIHFHLVPRWSGDTNFMPVLNDTKMISEDMKETFKKIQTFLQHSN